jgi:hypothetical protein
VPMRRHESLARACAIASAVLVVGACGASPGTKGNSTDAAGAATDAAGPANGVAAGARLPLMLVAEVDLPGQPTRFDYQDIDVGRGHPGLLP